MSKKSTFRQLKEQEKGLRRSIIIDAAEKQFSSRPFDEVNMRDIAKEAGISPSAIYRYFPDQQTLFVETFCRGIDEFLNTINETIDDSQEADAEDVIDTFINYFSENDHYFRVMMKFFIEGPVSSELFSKLNLVEKEMLDRLDRLFIKLGAEGEIRLMSHALFASLTGVLAIFRGHPEKSDREIIAHRNRIARIIVDMFRKAISEKQ